MVSSRDVTIAVWDTDSKARYSQFTPFTAATAIEVFE
jgi:hypothetical protein